MSDNELDDMASRAGFAVNMVGQIVAPAPSDDVRQPLRMFAELVRAAEREQHMAEIERLRVALHRITHFTSATPSLSESGC